MSYLSFEFIKSDIDFFAVNTQPGKLEGKFQSQIQDIVQGYLTLVNN